MTKTKEEIDQDIWEIILGGCQLDSDEREDNQKAIVALSEYFIANSNSSIDEAIKVVIDNDGDIKFSEDGKELIRPTLSQLISKLQSLKK